jgi:hypothetical protein
MVDPEHVEEGHAGQLELYVGKMPAGPLAKTVENTVDPGNDREGHTGQLDLNTVELPAEPF